MSGGKDGKRGEQYLVKKDGSRLKLQGITNLRIDAGDRLIIQTPGGGGFGKN